MNKFEKAKSKAWDAYYDLKDERDKKRNDLVYEYINKIDSKLEAEYGDRLRELSDAHTKAQAAAEQYDVEQAIANAKYLIGTIMCKWVVKSSWERVPQWEIECRGIVEVFTRESPRPDNQRFSLPSIGDIIVRILKKDGKPGLRVERINDTWLPEGKKPE